MNREFFDRNVETQLAPILHEGDVVILDTLATHHQRRDLVLLAHIRDPLAGSACLHAREAAQIEPGQLDCTANGAVAEYGQEASQGGHGRADVRH